jgi:ferredoxin
MLKSLKQKAGDLLSSGKVQVIVGYGEGTGGRPRPVFVRNPEDLPKLILDKRCTGNLAVYLAKPEVKTLGKPGIVATPAVVRSLVQLIGERQLTPDSVVALAVDGQSVVELTDAGSFEAYVASHPVSFPSHVTELMDSIGRMSSHQRHSFWDGELSRCFKCYACRSACPLCYCERCVTDVNQPQWVCVAPHALGVMEWHMNRAMHMAGRCIQCGSCTAACPAGIPIALLTIEATRSVETAFGYQAGIRCDASPALSSFKVEDKESFIL